MTVRPSWMPSQAKIEQEVESSYYMTDTDYGPEPDMSLDGLERMIYLAGVGAKVEALMEVLPLICPDCEAGTEVWGFDHYQRVTEEESVQIQCFASRV